MDDFKDVMLSELPSQHQRAPTLNANLSSLENYKGILLCDRPTDARMSMGQQPAPFLPPGKLDDRHGIGMQPSLEERMKHDLAKNMRQERTKNVPPTALNRHKQFLRKLNEQVRNTQDAAVEKLANKEEQRKKFQTAQSKFRNELREAAAVQLQQQQETEGNPPPPPAPTEETAPEIIAPKKASAPSKEKEKPTWAMTPEEAEEHEMNEAQKLVAFAQGLDFDQFINDFEVREALAVMAERVKEIQAGSPARATREDKDKAAEDDTVSVTASEKERRRTAPGGGDARHEKGWDASSKVDDAVRAALSADSLVLADRILGKNDHLRQIYSKQAMARMLQDAIATIHPDGLKGGLPPLRPRPEPALGPMEVKALAKPVVSSVSAEAQFGEMKRILVDLKKSKEIVQNLPYLYRCPSI